MCLQRAENFNLLFFCNILKKKKDEIESKLCALLKVTDVAIWYTQKSFKNTFATSNSLNINGSLQFQYRPSGGQWTYN